LPGGERLMDWHSFALRGFHLVEGGIIVYVAAVNTIYLFLMVLGYFALRRHNARLTRDERESLLRSPLVPPIAVLAPAYNEAHTIRDSIRSMLKLDYPHHEVIVVNDGSTDDTLRILVEEFRLYRSSRTWSAALPTQPVRAIYESRDPIRLVVVDKENGGKADALNAGINAARAPLVAAIDADSLLAEDALLLVVKPFLEDPERTVACGGIVRVVNGCDVEHGRVTRVSAPLSLMARFQAVEYLRAFLGGRVAFSFLNSLLLIAGAFGLFRRDALIEAGGFSTSTVGEDMEVVVRLHRRWREAGRDYRIAFVPEPVCWTQVPESLRTLRSQRNRWQRGTVETLRLHRRMLFNPRFGVLGLFGLPYYLCFEMLGPAVELAGYAVTLAGLALGLLDPAVALLFFIVSVLFGMLLSMSAVVLEEFTTRRYPSAADLARLFSAAVLENLGFRQLLTLWRVQALWDAARGKKGWGRMQRKVFQGGG
jgi:cellulose synthase/poly-beta-1,6-N-acetylglucosamine synthase-like glycosyltransferase